MSLTQINNLRQLEVTERISQFVDVEAEFPGFFKCVLSKHNGTWSLLMGILSLGESDSDAIIETCCYQYPEYQFLCQPIPKIKLSELISSLDSEDEFPLAVSGMDNFIIDKSAINWTEALIPSHVSSNGFPIRRFSGELCSKVYFRESKLIAHDMDFHSSASKYIKEFLGLQVFHGSSDGRTGELYIDIPDRRGSITVSDHEVGFNCATEDPLSLVGSIDGEAVSLRKPQDSVAMQTETATDVELWLVSDSHEIIDYRSSSEWEYRFEGKGDDKKTTELLKVISAGESEHCEFKQYISLETKRDKKAWDIDKTVCAFSNHQGGKLFIGVDDEIRIIGINDGLQKDYKLEPEKAIEKYQQAVIDRLRESLNKNQCFKVYPIEHKGLYVLVVEVFKAPGLNYLLDKKEAYIRRGASSPQLTPSEIQAFSVDQGALGHESYTSEFAEY